MPDKVNAAIARIDQAIDSKMAELRTHMPYWDFEKDANFSRLFAALEDANCSIDVSARKPTARLLHEISLLKAERSGAVAALEAAGISQGESANV